MHESSKLGIVGSNPTGCTKGKNMITSTNNSPTIKKLLEHKRNTIREMLYKCTEKEIAIFIKMYGSIDHMEEQKMDWAIVQIENTLEKHEMV